MVEMTPIRVRGKRHGTKAEKWNYGKQRKIHRNGSSVTSEGGSSAISTDSDRKSSSRRRRRPRNPDLSQLEQLPTEVIQSIFEFSANVSLPLASPRLASQLESNHLYHELTSTILQPLLGGRDATKAELSSASRLMNCKFFTWSFFDGWLRNEFKRRHLVREWQSAVGSDHETMNPERQTEWTWYKLQPHGGLLPPTKLLRGPFTDEKIRFLRFIVSSFREETASLDPFYAELVNDGLHQAVAEGAGDALPAFWTLGASPDTELLRQAVIDSGCKREVVQRLVTRVLHLASGPIDVDFLDPALWSWAEKVNAQDDKRGTWLLDLLRESARASGCREVEIRQAKAAMVE